MLVLIRLDADRKIGMGHFTRSLSIANQIRKIKGNEIDIIFLTSEDEFTKKELTNLHFTYFLKKENESEETFLYKAVTELNAKVLFIDKSYPYQSKLIKEIKKILTVIMFHNICEGSYHADIFILPTIHSPEKFLTDPRWKKNGVRFYHGNKYIVINEQILTLNKKTDIDSGSTRVVITTGGSDPKGILIRLLNWLSISDLSNLKITALQGQLFTHTKELNALRSKLPEHIIIKKYDPNLLPGNNLAICTFGLSTYEMLYIGVPVLSIGHQASNALASKILEDRYRAVVDLGCIDDLSKEKFISTLYILLNNKRKLAELSQTGMRLLDGKGAYRVAKLIIGAAHK